MPSRTQIAIEREVGRAMLRRRAASGDRCTAVRFGFRQRTEREIIDVQSSLAAVDGAHHDFEGTHSLERRVRRSPGKL